LRRRVLLLLLSLVATAAVLGLVFAGSPTTLADGVTIDGVDVGGLHAKDARALLERRSSASAHRPVVFVAAGKRFTIRPIELGVEPDWKAAIDAAERQGDGFGPLRGFKRLDVQVFGADVTPPIRVLNGALQYKLELIAKDVNRAPRDAAVVRRGLKIAVVPARVGTMLDRRAAARTVVRELAALDRTGTHIELPLVTRQPHVRSAALARAARQARVALSAPVRLQLGPTRWVLRPRRIARLLELPADGHTRLAIGGAAARDWLVRLARRVEKPAQDATFSVNGARVQVVPARPGTRLDVARAADAVLLAASKRRPGLRVAQLPVVESAPKVTTAAARAMRIRGLVSSYTTVYGGIPQRGARRASRRRKADRSG
jgi:hypothetical protein